jgi:hypothetical protein
MVSACSPNGEKDTSKCVYRLLAGKPEGKILLARTRRRWVDNIKTDLLDIGWGDVDWSGPAKDRNRWGHQVPLNAGKLWSGLTSSGLSSSAQLHRVC